jgi:hypothetical protein
MGHIRVDLQGKDHCYQNLTPGLAFEFKVATEIHNHGPRKISSSPIGVGSVET